MINNKINNVSKNNNIVKLQPSVDSIRNISPLSLPPACHIVEQNEKKTEQNNVVHNKQIKDKNTIDCDCNCIVL